MRTPSVNGVDAGGADAAEGAADLTAGCPGLRDSTSA